MGLMNRLANSQNYHQGKYPRVLTVCSAGLLRSPTIAWIISQEPYNCNARAAGVSDDYGLIIVDDVLVNWAQTIICAEDCHADFITSRWPDLDKGNDATPIYALNVPDNYGYRNPELIEAIKEKFGLLGLFQS